MISTSTYSVPQAARRIGVAPITLWRAKARGELPHHRVGRRVVVSEQDLAEYMAACAVPAIKPGRGPGGSPENR